MELSKVKARQMLEEIYRTVYDIKLTRTPLDGARVFYATYKKIAEYAAKNEWVDREFIIDIENVTFDEIACAAKILSALLKDDDDRHIFKIKDEDEDEE